MLQLMIKRKEVKNMKIIKGITLQLYPNQQQRNQLQQMFGNERFVWNHLLDMANQRYKNNPNSQFLNAYQMNYLLKPLKSEYPFLKKSDSSSLQVVTHNLEQAFKTLFQHRGGHPKFQSYKRTKQSYTGKSTIKVIAKRYLKLPKLGYVKSSKTSRLLNGKIKRYTITHLPTDKYQLSVALECESQALPKTGKTVGIDLGLHDLMILSDASQPKIKKFTTKYLDQQAKIWQRKFNRRKNKATKAVRQWNHNHKAINEEIDDYQNWQQAKQVKACYQDKAKRKRFAYLQWWTTQLVKHYDVIIMEDLKARNMMKNHHLADSVAHACWRKIREMLTYKCTWYGKQLVIVNPRNTSRICHTCGHLQQQFKNISTNEWLATRKWTCEACGVYQDRDRNATMNILQRGLQQLNN